MNTESRKNIFKFLDEEYGWLKSEPYLDEKSEKTLLKSAREGNVASREQIIKSWLHLALYGAAKYSYNLNYFPDLVNAGVVGLAQALERFDYKRGNRFSTLATWWVRQNISRSLHNETLLIRLPEHIWGNFNKLKKYLQDIISLDSTYLYEDDLRDDYDISELYQYDRISFESLPRREKYIVNCRIKVQKLIRLKTIFPEVRDWVYHIGLKRSLMTCNEVTKKLNKNEFNEFFKSYEKELSPIEGDLDIVGNRCILTEKIIKAVSFERLWKIRWNGSICEVIIKCGKLYKINVELAFEYLIFSLQIEVYALSDYNTNNLYVKPGYFIKKEIVNLKKVYTVCGKIYHKANAKVLSKVIQDLIYQVNVCNIQVSVLTNQNK